MRKKKEGETRMDVDKGRNEKTRRMEVGERRQRGNWRKERGSEEKGERKLGKRERK